MIGELVKATPPWMIDAACRGVDPKLFFPDLGECAAEAVAVCMTCPVREECLEYALGNNERIGVWGGTLDRQRRRIRSARAKAAKAAAE